MRNLKIWQKLALLGCVFMVPFAVVTYQMMSAINALGLESAQLEVHGLAYNPPALRLLKNLQLRRDMASARLAGDKSFDAALATNRAEIESTIAGLDQIDQQLTGVLHTADRWSVVRKECNELLTKAGDPSADESFAEHSKVISDVIAMIAAAGRASNLTLDPDVDRNRLIDVLIKQGPELSEALAQARGLGTVVAGTGKRTPEEVESLSRDAVLVEFLGAEMDESLAAALESQERLRSQLQDRTSATGDAVLGAMAEIVNVARGESAGRKPSEYFALVTRGIDSINELEGQITATLNNSLALRIATLRREIQQTLAWAAFGLLVVSLIAFVIIRDITVSLRRVVTVANRIAIGDLTMPAASMSRKDEIGVLARAFDSMVSALKETVAVAERIAAGDLAVTVKPRSDRDVMGTALAHMVERLSALVGEVQQSDVQVNSSVNQIAATARQQQATTAEIAATTTQIRATSKQIASTSKTLALTMSEVSVGAEQSADLAGSSQDGVARMEATMRNVMEAAGSINAKLAVLNEKASGITQVVTTITRVADQTNLLSLNAAIEAEKAGEYGRGFSVVAIEIRRLADQTAVATFDIEEMVKEIQSAVTAGVMGMEKFSDEVRNGIFEVQQVGQQLSQIIQQVQALAPRFRAVNDGMEAQATGAAQITEALGQLDSAVQQTVESLRESSDVIHGLNDAARGMRSGVSRFKVAA